MSIVKITGSFSLRRDAANAYERMRSAGMPSGGINSAYRSVASQRALFLARYRVQLTGRGPYGDVRWYQGKRYVRHSSAGMVGVPGTSKHNAGIALDIATASAAQRWMLANAARYGWRRTISSEPWHWEHDGRLDRDAVQPIQRAVRVTTDGIWGTGTDRATWAVRAASNFRGPKFPYGRKYTQARVGTKADNVWGANSRAAHDMTAKNLQRAVKRLGFYSGKIDGIWGKGSDGGFLKARKVFKR